MIPQENDKRLHTTPEDWNIRALNGCAGRLFGSGRKLPRPGDIKISYRDDEPVIPIQPTTDQDVEDTTESDSEAIVKEVRKSIESNIKQIGTNLSADAIRSTLVCN